MPIDWAALAPQMLAAAKGVLKKQWPQARDYAEFEMKKLTDTLMMIEKLYADGKISEDEARLHLQLQRNAARTVLLTLQGLGILAVEEALNAALNVVQQPLNAALGFRLL